MNIFLSRKCSLGKYEYQLIVRQPIFLPPGISYHSPDQSITKFNYQLTGDEYATGVPIHKTKGCKSLLYFFLLKT